MVLCTDCLGRGYLVWVVAGLHVAGTCPVEVDIVVLYEPESQISVEFLVVDSNFAGVVQDWKQDPSGEEVHGHCAGYSGFPCFETVAKMHCTLAECCSAVLAKNLPEVSIASHYYRTVDDFGFELSLANFYRRLEDDCATLLCIQECDSLYLLTGGTDLEDEPVQMFQTGGFVVDSNQQSSLA